MRMVSLVIADNGPDTTTSITVPSSGEIVVIAPPDRSSPYWTVYIGETTERKANDYRTAVGIAVLHLMAVSTEKVPEKGEVH